MKPTSDEDLTSKHFSNATKPRPQLTHSEIGLAMHIQYLRKEEEQEARKAKERKEIEEHAPKIQLPYRPPEISVEEIHRLSGSPFYPWRAEKGLNEH